MLMLFAEHKNRLTELIALYRDRVDFLTIRLEQTEDWLGM